MISYMRCILLFGLVAGRMVAGDVYPSPEFADRQRIQKLESAMPRIDGIFRAYAAD